MRIFFSVGEPSGDLHGANLIKDLRQRQPDLQAVGFGGHRMEEAGCRLLFDLTSLAVMGVWNVLLNVRQFFALLAEADRYFSRNQVDAVVLIDYPGFNWWIARKARKHNIQVFYYGVPQMWAWLPWRVHKLRRLVDHVMCKLPFEEKWFRSRGCQATYVGHPYFDELVRYPYDRTFMDQQQPASHGEKLLVLLPGSRNQEVKRNLQGLLQAAELVRQSCPGTQVVIACFRAEHAEFARRQLPADLPARVFVQRTPELIAMADACIACSGSVSLELLFHRKPAVIVYRVSAIVMLLQLVLLRSRFITLVNMLDLERVEKSANPPYDPDQPDCQVPMPEYLTWRDASPQVATWVRRWFEDPRVYAERVQRLEQLAGKFAHAGASQRAAEFVWLKLQSGRALESSAARSDRQVA